MSLEGMEALSVGATEINKGLTELSAIVKLVDDIDVAKFVDLMKEMLPRLVAMRDFSLKVMGFIGVAARDIDWDNPELYFEQIKSEKEALNAALSESKANEHKLKEDLDKFAKTLAEHEDLMKSEREAMKRERDGWRITKNFSIGGLIGLFIFANIVLFLIQVFTKVPVFNLFWGGLIKLFKGTKQLVKGVQDVREHFKRADPEKTYTAKEVQDIIDGKLMKHTDESVKKLVENIKDKHNIKEQIIRENGYH